MTFDYDSYRELEKLSRVELVAEIDDRAQQLVHALEIVRQPDVYASYVQFDLEERSVKMPDFAVQSLDPTSLFSHLSVDFEKSRETNSASLSLAFTVTPGISAEPVTLFVTQESDALVSRIIVGDSAPIDTLYQPSPEEIAVFLASIFMHSTTGNYDIFKKMDLWDPGVLSRLEEALSKNADATISNAIYHINTDGNLIHSIEYTKEDESISSVRLSRDDTPTATILDITLDGSDFSGDYSLESLEGVRAYQRKSDNDSATPIDCSTETLVGFIDFVKELSESIHSSDVEIATSKLDTVNPDPSSDYTDSTGKSLRSDDNFNID